MKKGIVLSIDVFIASLIVIMFITTFFFYKVESNIHEKIKSDRISDVLFVLEDEFKLGNQDLIEETLLSIMPAGWKYQLVVDYYDKEGSVVKSFVIGSDLNEVIAVDRRGFVVMDESNIKTFGVAEMRVGR